MTERILAFDLSLEKQRIDRPIPYGADQFAEQNRAKNHFFENGWTYAKEASGVKVAQFKPYIIEREQGVVTLSSELWKLGPVHELFNPDTTDPHIIWPEHRKHGINYERAKTEYRAFRQFEKSEELANAQEGDMFIWISPPPTSIVMADYSLEEKEERLETLGYGLHSFTFVYTVQNGELKSTAIKNYLDPERHQDILSLTTGFRLPVTHPDDYDFLGKIYKVMNPDIVSAFDVIEAIDLAYELTPEEVKITSPDHVGEVDEHYMNMVLRRAQPVLEYTYYLLRHANTDDLSYPEIRALTEFYEKKWEQTLIDLRDGKEIDISEFDGLFEDDLENKAVSALQAVRSVAARREHRYDADYPDQTYQLLSQAFGGMPFIHFDRNDSNGTKMVTACGVGSGFGSIGSSRISIFSSLEQSVVGVSGIATTYESAGLLSKESKKTLKCFCPLCDPNREKQQVLAVIENGKISCPRCRKCLPYQC